MMKVPCGMIVLLLCQLVTSRKALAVHSVRMSRHAMRGFQGPLPTGLCQQRTRVSSFVGHSRGEYVDCDHQITSAKAESLAVGTVSHTWPSFRSASGMALTEFFDVAN